MHSGSTSSVKNGQGAPIKIITAIAASGSNNNNKDGKPTRGPGLGKSLKNEISFVTTSNQFSLELQSGEGRPRFSCWTRACGSCDHVTVDSRNLHWREDLYEIG